MGDQPVTVMHHKELEFGLVRFVEIDSSRKINVRIDL
uniref:Uncharacterized protein n=1 Tax=Arundo donax TaxID=35708 RepID=A0A0A8XYR6_ARUDO